MKLSVPAITLVFTAMLTVSSANAINFDLSKRSPIDQMRVDRYCKTGDYILMGSQPTDGEFMLCEILKRIDQQNERLEDIEDRIKELSKDR